ncbi:MAG: hypothetical protein HY784_11750 [Chloroflexi bacterium]|nr:hypothetical protein [Chloroflexota bacterium]
MPRIRCHYEDCVFLEDRYCGAAAVELDPDQGCLTYQSVNEVPVAEGASEWDDDEFEDEWEEDEPLYEDGDDLDEDLAEEDDDDL